ncbi:MAG: alpha,alpha-phosphotrehalase [Culicoidibacterales bacterium]
MKWWKNQTVYQVYPLSYNDSNDDGRGDLQGIIAKIPYIKSLGVGIIWLTPIYQSPMDDNGYDISDYYQINPLFGTMADFELLLAEIHKHGLKLMMDLVVNHTSDEHAWFKEAIANKKSKYRDYYLFSDEIATAETSFFGGGVWEYSTAAGQYYYHLFSKRQPDLNWDNEHLRQDVYAMMNWWLDKGVDAFRLDVIDFIGKEPFKQIRSGEKTHTYLQEMHQACFAFRDAVMTVGEMTTATIENTPLYTKRERKELDMVFHFEIASINQDKNSDDKWSYRPFNLVELKRCFEKWQVGLHNNGWNALYWCNHDQPRVVSTFGDPVNYHYQSATMLAGLLHGMQGTPYIYQGEEIGMTNIRLEAHEYRDVEILNLLAEHKQKGIDLEQTLELIYRKGRDNARTPMQWNTDAYAGFSKVPTWLAVNPNYQEINVAAAIANKTSIWYWYAELVALRKKEPIIVEGDFQLLEANHPQLFAYQRQYQGETITVYANFLGTDLEVELPCTGEVIMANYRVPLDNILRPFEFIMWKN